MNDLTQPTWYDNSGTKQAAASQSSVNALNTKINNIPSITIHNCTCAYETREFDEAATIQFQIINYSSTQYSSFNDLPDIVLVGQMSYTRNGIDYRSPIFITVEPFNGDDVYCTYINYTGSSPTLTKLSLPRTHSIVDNR